MQYFILLGLARTPEISRAEVKQPEAEKPQDPPFLLWQTPLSAQTGSFFLLLTGFPQQPRA